MAELSAAASAGVVASERDALLATKLYVPGPRPGFVPRPRLAAALGEGLARGLILVCAPAGFGKTALLADWVRSGDRRVAWLSLDAADSDPVRFWRHVVAALDRARPGIGERVAPLLGQPRSSFEGLVTALINELAAQPGEDELLLVLDDYHLVDARQVGASLAFLLEHLPPGLRLVVASRSDPPLPLARPRASGQLAELRAGELRFTAEEAGVLLREATGADLPGPAVAALAARTEGWAAGLQLAALSLRGQADPAGFVAAFSGSHRYVLDYLAGEVLDRQPEEVRAFLLQTSVLERLSGGLCDAVTGLTGGQVMLEQVERANLFLVPLDEVRGWWRYHYLFADLLRARLQQEHPDRLAALHRNAAAWSEEHGLAGDAVRHAVAAGDAAWAARLIERHVDALLLRSEGATVQRWLAALPAELVQSRPRLSLAHALLAATSGRAEAVEPPLDAAERALAGAARAVDEPFEPSAGRAASMLANVPALIALHRSYNYLSPPKCPVRNVRVCTALSIFHREEVSRYGTQQEILCHGAPWMKNLELLGGRWFADLTRFRTGLDGVPAGSGLAHHETSGGLGLSYGGSGSRVSPVWARNPLMSSGRYWILLSRFLTMAARSLTVGAARLPRPFFMFAQTPSAGLRSGA